MTTKMSGGPGVVDNWIDLLNKHGAFDLSLATALVNDTLWSAQKIAEERFGNKDPRHTLPIFEWMMRVSEDVFKNAIVSESKKNRL